jgi:hypothetical protein
MNNMTFICEIEIDRPDGPAGTDIAGLNQALRRDINRPRGYTRPVELAARRLREALRHATPQCVGVLGISTNSARGRETTGTNRE